MYQQTLSAVRDEIVSAMHVDVRTRGQLEIDGSAVVVPSRRSRIYKVADQFPDSKDSNSSQSKELINVDPVRACESRSFKTSSCPLPANAFKSTRVTRVVNALPLDLFSLAQFAYAERCEWKHTEQVAKQLWAQFKSLQETAFRAKKLDTLKSMVFVSMQSWKHLVTTGGELYTPAKIRELLDLNEHTWRRDWLPHWRLMHELLSDTEQKVLKNVYEETRAQRRADKDHASA